jgi:hypothetical protein
MLRPPRTLWRLYLMDLLRLVALAAGVLVTVIAFAGAVKPISDGVLDAADAVKYILLAIPPMLAYALPFAGGFASTLVYHRMATDLEATAAYASGVSHRSLLAPALGLALTCAACLVALNEQVIPRFLERMQRLVTTDVGRLIAQRVERGEGVAFKGVMLHADHVQRVAPRAGHGACSTSCSSPVSPRSFTRTTSPTEKSPPSAPRSGSSREKAPPKSRALPASS